MESQPMLRQRFPGDGHDRTDGIGQIPLPLFSWEASHQERCGRTRTEKAAD
jgi:hypothetical protein